MMLWHALIARSFPALAFIPAVALASSACSGGNAAAGAAPASAAGRPAVPVAIATVVQKPMPLDLHVVGTVEAYSTVAVRAQITGQLTSVNFREGDDVEKGQVLFELDRRPLEAELKQAQANLLRDRAQAANAEAQYRRYQDLVDRGIATREQLETARATAEALAATVGADEAAVERATVQLQYATIAAPIAGRTGALMVHPGNIVRANDPDPLVLINQVSPINVSFGLPEGQLGALKRYQGAGSTHVDILPPNDEERPLRGRISFIDNAVDQTTGTIKVKATLTNEARRLWPGQFVNVVVTLTTEPAAIVIPTVAVQTGPNGPYVFVVKADQTVDMRPVEIARSNGVETVIGRGLQAGETVVTDGQLRLTPGSLTTLKPSA
jgi:multidrug efflux system membrane fusion protein